MSWEVFFTLFAAGAPPTVSVFNCDFADTEIPLAPLFSFLDDFELFGGGGGSVVSLSNSSAFPSFISFILSDSRRISLTVGDQSCFSCSGKDG